MAVLILENVQWRPGAAAPPSLSMVFRDIRGVSSGRGGRTDFGTVNLKNNYIFFPYNQLIPDEDESAHSTLPRLGCCCGRGPSWFGCCSWRCLEALTGWVLVLVLELV